MNRVQHIGGNSDSAPASIEAEQEVIGMLLIHPDNIGLVMQAGGRELFHEQCHADLLDVISQRQRDGLLVSPVTLREFADAHDGLKQLGGAGYLVRMAGVAVSHKFVGGYLDLLSDLKSKRELLAAMSDANASILRGEDQAVVIAGRLEAALMEAKPSGGIAPVSMLRAVTVAVEQIIAAKNGDSEGSVTSGIGALDRIVSGFFPGELILLGGRPSMGKTALALSISLNIARAGHGVVICSLEMNPEAMALRAISEATARQKNAVNYSSMRRAGLTDYQLESVTSAAKEVAELPITFLPREYSDVGALIAGAKQAKRMLGDNMKLFVVDYAQLLTAKASNRYEEITKISLALKGLAGQLNVPVLALSQLSRKLDERVDKRPILSDLRESGQLEQDADTVMFCYRDEYYLHREEPDAKDAEKHDLWAKAVEAKRNTMEIIVAKQRQGEIGTAHVNCNPALNLIWE